MAEATQITLEAFEYGILLKKTDYKSRTFKLRIPKLMALIPAGEPKDTPDTINKNIFANEVKPTVPSSIKTRNYVTIEKYAQADFEYFTKDYTVDPYIAKGTKLKISTMYGNLDNMRVTDDI